MADPALSSADLAAIDALLADDDADRLARYRGSRTDRQPVHTVYVPADRFHADLGPEWGRHALELLDAHAPRAEQMASLLEVDPGQIADVWDRVRAKLEAEPIEDMRIDTEDGYGVRDGSVEDADAREAATAVARAAEEGTLPPHCGIRFKSLEASTRQRGLRTLDLVLGRLTELGGLPSGWVVTLPKVTSLRQVEAMGEICRRLEAVHGLDDRSLSFEVQVETPQAIVSADGTATAARIVHAGDGRVVGLHFGTYDYTAALGIAGGDQALDHPAADFAKSILQIAAAGTPVRVSDGSTNVLPQGDGDTVRAAWKLHARLVRRALERGLYQGWDLHPGQLPTRYLATYTFFRRDLEGITGRLHRYLHGDAGAVLDEPATAQAMAVFLLRGVHCGAVDAGEIGAMAGIDVERLTELAARRVG